MHERIDSEITDNDLRELSLAEGEDLFYEPELHPCAPALLHAIFPTNPSSRPELFPLRTGKRHSCQVLTLRQPKK